MRTLLTAAAALALAACAVEKTPVPTGGSRADASIDMSFEVGGFESPVVDWDAARATAAQRCRAWDYADAEPFEGTRTECSQYDPGLGCMMSTVTRTYQCT